MAASSPEGSYPLDNSPASLAEKRFLTARAQLNLRGFRRKMRHLGFSSGMDVLDLGCGDGSFTLRLATICQPGKVIGLDPHQTFIEQAIQRSVKANARCHFTTGQADALPFPDHSMDAVYARLVFQHLVDPLRGLQETFRVLRPGAMLVVEDVDLDMMCLNPSGTLWDRIHLALRNGHREDGGDPGIGRKLPALMRKAGFERIQSRPICTHANGQGVVAFAKFLGPSLVSAIKEDSLREEGLHLMRLWQEPKYAQEVDLYATHFTVTARRPFSLSRQG